MTSPNRSLSEQKILTVSANREHFPEPVFPIGAVYVAQALTKAGAEVRVFDAGLHRSPWKALSAEVGSFHPELIAVSLRNVDNAAYPCTRHYLDDHAEMMRVFRSATEAPVILGGSALSIFPEELVDALGADAGMIGDGESAAAVLRQPPSGVIRLPDAAAEQIGLPGDLDRVFPLFHRYHTVGVQTARGCPFRCVYCTYPLIEGFRRIRRPVEAVLADMELLARKFGKSELFLVDSVLNADEAHLRELLEGMIRKGLDVRFSCYLRPFTSDPSLFSLLRRAGCIAVDFGTDSGSDEMLQTLGKSFDTDDVLAASDACRSAGIDFCHSLLFGGPGERPDTIAQTVRLMDRASPRAVIAMTGIRLYPGTQLTRKAVEEGQVSSEVSLLAPVFFRPAVGLDEMVECVYRTAAGRGHWFFPGKRDWSEAVGPRLLRLFHREGPLWRRLRNRRRSAEK